MKSGLVPLYYKFAVLQYNIALDHCKLMVSNFKFELVWCCFLVKQCKFALGRYKLADVLLSICTEELQRCT
jgi:hypothetical protein